MKPIWASIEARGKHQINCKDKQVVDTEKRNLQVATNDEPIITQAYINDMSIYVEIQLTNK